MKKVSRTKSEAGIYKLRFCKNGQWTTVTIDDQIPCKVDKGPIYSRSNGKNEIWVLTTL